MESKTRKHKSKKGTILQKVPRIELFSDAVCAIAITLLIINCIETRHPSIHHQPLWESLLDQWPIFLCFILAFYTIFICWINHYMIFSYTERTCGALLWGNGFVLFMITVIPFPTAVISENIQSNGHSTLIFCGVIYFFLALAYHLLWRSARKNGLFFTETSDLQVRSITLLYRFGVLYTGIALLVSWYSVVGGIILYIIMLIVFGFPKRFTEFFISVKIIKPKNN